MKLQPALFLFLPFLLGACASLSMEPSGFLSPSPGLEPAPERHVAFIPDEIHVYRSAEPADFGAVYVEPTEFHLVSDADVKLDEEDRADLERAFGNYLRKNLGKDYELADGPGPGVAVVRSAITDVEPSSVLLNVIGIILIVPFDMGGISGEIEVVDDAGRPLLQWKANRGGTPFLVVECFQRWGHAYHGMMKWSQELREVLAEPAG